MWTPVKNSLVFYADQGKNPELTVVRIFSGSSPWFACLRRRELKHRTFLSHGRQPEKCFSYLTCLHTTTFMLLSSLLLVRTICSETWERPLSRCGKSSLPVSFRGPKTSRTEALYYIFDTLIIVVNAITFFTIIVANVIIIIVIIIVVIIIFVVIIVVVVVVVIIIIIIIIQKCT